MLSARRYRAATASRRSPGRGWDLRDRITRDRALKPWHHLRPGRQPAITEGGLAADTRTWLARVPLPSYLSATARGTQETKRREAMYYIAYFHQGFPCELPGDPERCTSLRAATEAFREFTRATGRDYYDEYGTAGAALYQCDSEDEWAEAQRFAGAGCPFDYPSYLLGIGKRGGITRSDASHSRRAA